MRAGYAVLYEIVDGNAVIIGAIRHQLEDDYYQSVTVIDSAPPWDINRLEADLNESSSFNHQNLGLKYLSFSLNERQANSCNKCSNEHF